MSYKQNTYQAKNVYLPKELCKMAEERAERQFMNFSVYIRALIVKDLEESSFHQGSITKQ